MLRRFKMSFFVSKYSEMCCLWVVIVLVASYFIKKLFFDENLD